MSLFYFECFSFGTKSIIKVDGGWFSFFPGMGVGAASIAEYDWCRKISCERVDSESLLGQVGASGSHRGYNKVPFLEGCLNSLAV